MEIKEYRVHVYTKQGEPIYTSLNGETERDPFGFKLLRETIYITGAPVVLNKENYRISKVIFGVFGPPGNLLFDTRIEIEPEPVS